MTIADIGLIASFVMIAWVVVDWRRGKTALGRHRLTKEGTPDRFWMALVLYLNMAFVLFWLQGKAYAASFACNPGDEGCASVALEMVAAAAQNFAS